MKFELIKLIDIDIENEYHPVKPLSGVMSHKVEDDILTKIKLIKILKKHIRLTKIRPPLYVREFDDSLYKYKLMDGFYTYMAYGQLKFKTAPCFVVKNTDIS